jgi:hypothetical protein
MMDRDAWLSFCKERAFEHLDYEDLPCAYASVISDLAKHPTTSADKETARRGMALVIQGDKAGLRAWIENFQ